MVKRGTDRPVAKQVGISVEALAREFPRLYHMAEPGSWGGIQRHGLLSTSALLDLFEITGAERHRIESKHRKELITITHPAHGSAVIRDQKPMDDSGLRRALGDGMSPQEWYELLNRHAFFWLSPHRLQTLLRARAYRDRRQTILTISTSALLREHSRNVLLSPINSGATKPFPHPRGRATFLPLDAYPYADWRSKRGRRDSIVELVVEYAVPGIIDAIEKVEEIGGGLPNTVLWSR